MEVLDSSIANVALPHIAGGLSAGQDESTWVLTRYLVSNAIVRPMSGWLTTVIGRKSFYMTCVALFTFSSILCGLAPTLPLLIVFRILQGALAWIPTLICLTNYFACFAPGRIGYSRVHMLDIDST